MAIPNFNPISFGGTSPLAQAIASARQTLDQYTPGPQGLGSAMWALTPYGAAQNTQSQPDVLTDHVPNVPNLRVQQGFSQFPGAQDPTAPQGSTDGGANARVANGFSAFSQPWMPKTYTGTPTVPTPQPRPAEADANQPQQPQAGYNGAPQGSFRAPFNDGGYQFNQNGLIAKIGTQLGLFNPGVNAQGGINGAVGATSVGGAPLVDSDRQDLIAKMMRYFGSVPDQGAGGA